VLAVLILKEKLSRRAALGVGCSVVGTVLLVSSA
jgi:drug/metabolite transporter (DMT)-like permease